MASASGGSMAPRNAKLPGLRILGGDSTHYSLDIVLIPGVGTPAVDQWPFASPEWLAQCLSQEQASDTRLLTFQYAFTLDDNFTWGSLWQQGDQLLQALARSRRNDGSEADGRPILFVCHSLGGLILKQALCIAKEQLHRYETLINVVSGIIFLGTPHFRSHEGDKGIDIIQATTKSKIKLPRNDSHESQILSDLSARFEATRIRCPILSVYETVRTKVPRSRFRRKWTVVLVDKDTCTIHAPLEQFLPVPLDHIEICKFRSIADSQAAIVNFVNIALRSAKSDIQSRMEAMEYRYATTSICTPTRSDESFEIIGDGPKRDPLDTAAATYGSMAKSSSSQEYEVIPVGTKFGRRAVPQLPCKMLEADSRNPSFSGREEILENIGHALLPPTEFISTISEPLRRFTLCGMGGLGKTELAIEFAFRNTDAFDAIFFVSADETSKLDAQFSEIAVRLGLETSAESTNHVISRELVKGWLCNPVTSMRPRWDDLATVERASWLLIFDNADNPYILTDYWPIQGTGSVLITSRDPLAKTIFTTVPSGLDLEPLTEHEGGALLKKISNDKDPEGLSGQVSNLLGGLPLAIAQMAGVIRREELRFSEFMEIYKDHSEHPRLYQLDFPLRHKVYRRTISTVWALQSLKPGTKQLLHILAFMDPDCIQENVLTAPPLRGEGCPDSLLSSSKHFRDARTELLQASLIRRNKNTEELRIHRLVQDMVLTQLTTDSLKEIFWAIVNLLWSHWPTAFSPPTRKGPTPSENLHLISRWPRCAALYPHVLRLKLIYENQGIDVLGPATLKFAALLADAAWYQFERGRSRGFDGFWDIALPACENCSDDGRQSVLVDISFCMGAIAMETNDRDSSRSHKERALSIQKETQKVLGVTDLRLSRCYSEMAIAFIQGGQYDDGIAHALYSIDIDKQLGVYPRNWHAEANLGLAYTLKGDLQRADDVLASTLARREALFGYMDNKDYRLGRVLHAFGYLREVQGRQEESFELYTRALTSFEATIGKNHHRVADLSHKVAEHLFRQGNNTQALEKCDRALEIWTYDESAYQPEIARTTFLKHIIFKSLGNDVKSRVLYKQASLIREKFLPPGTSTDTELFKKDFDALVNFWGK